ncbi:hypothetical protein VNO77_18079 [Canavalia gladiata]|uniref:DUF761 domain-containing protein n=1 Tax=Canavalia gladiata TaxID=3824 RepID=A0AAN9LK58_CANGL
MEQIPQSAMITITTDLTLEDDQRKPTQGAFQRRKTKGAINVLRVALFVMRGHRSRKSNKLRLEDGSKSVWTKVVGSMRPLHLQSNQSSGSISQLTTALPSPSPSSSEDEPYSPYSPSPTSSRYASAVGLNELVQSDEDNEKQEVIMEESNEHENEHEHEHDDGDEMVDAKADEFIARFYEQMRLQRLDSADRRYNERRQRSLGL